MLALRRNALNEYRAWLRLCTRERLGSDENARKMRENVKLVVRSRRVLFDLENAVAAAARPTDTAAGSAADQKTAIAAAAAGTRAETSGSVATGLVALRLQLQMSVKGPAGRPKKPAAPAPGVVGMEAMSEAELDAANLQAMRNWVRESADARRALTSITGNPLLVSALLRKQLRAQQKHALAQGAKAAP
jgi:hypothetical protein